MYTCKLLLAAILCTGIAGFAVVSLASDTGMFASVGNPTALEKSDDPVRNGLRIIQTRSMDSSRKERSTNDDSTVILLDNWIFTDKASTSPYQ